MLLKSDYGNRPITQMRRLDIDGAASFTYFALHDASGVFAVCYKEEKETLRERMSLVQNENEAIIMYCSVIGAAQTMEGAQAVAQEYERILKLR